MATTQDPYAYAANNPVNYSDPTGLDWTLDPRDWEIPDCPFGRNPNGSCRGSGVAETADDVWDDTYEATTHAVDVVGDAAYEVQGFVGRNVVRPLVGVGTVGFTFTVGSNVGFLLGGAVCGVGPWAVP